jgi:hypothetical protein
MKLAVPTGILLAVATAGLADEAPAPGTTGRPVPVEGARVKLEFAGGLRPIVGTLRRIEADSLLLDVHAHGEPVTVDRRSIARVSLSAGTRNQAAKGAVLGAVIGLGATVLALQVAPGLCPACSDDSYWTFTARASLVVGAPLGALIGAAAGGARRADVWKPAELPSASPGAPAEFGVAPHPGTQAGARRGVAITIRV